MDRRGFFKHSIKSSKKKLVKQIDAHAEKRAKNWIRPPFALDELDFLLACTRCDKCINACPYEVIFPLPARLGSTVVGTPALDLLNKGCHLCEQWPCVTACQSGAMSMVSDVNEELNASDQLQTENIPALAAALIDSHKCLPYQGPECGACKDSCPIDNALIFENEKPHINSDKCVGCALCRDACIVDPKAIIIKSLGSTQQ